MKSFIAVLFFLGLIAVSLADPYMNNPYNNNYRGRDQYSNGYMMYPRSYNNNYNNRPMNYNTGYNSGYQPSYQMRPSYNTYSSHPGPYNSYRPSYPKA